MVRPARAKTAKYCSYACHQVGEGRKGGAVTGERFKALSQGKTYTKTGGRHTHRVVAEMKLGRPLLPGEIVHHEDENIFNNNPENLKILNSQSDHIRIHLPEMLQARKEKYGY